jgi:hypothetical protein
MHDVSISPSWLPFAPPDPASKPQISPELIGFLNAMQDGTDGPAYLNGVYKMILEAFSNTEEVPDSYAEFLSAFIGKPVALTNIGYSLELGTAEKKDQTVYPSGDPSPEKSVLTYELPLKIGDQKRSYDGLVGYFNPGEPKKIYTYCTDNTGEGSPATPIEPKTYPLITPFFIDPMDTDYVIEKNKKLSHMVALLDPFVPLHVYTGFLPISEIKLPKWHIETALKKMTAFFQLGPVVTTKDVPPFDATQKLNVDYGGDVVPFQGKGLAVPARLKKEDWVWLQPYATDDNLDEPQFMALNVDAAEEKQRWEPVPYTAVEGYLQLKRAVGEQPPRLNE